MRSLFLIVFLATSTYAGNLFAQDKFEKESRIKENHVPKKALEFLESLNYSTRIKWYREEGLIKESIEAKFRHNKTNYSVEFDSLGNIEDIEIEVNFEELDSEVKNKLIFQFKADCLKYKIVKVQKQYLGNENLLLTLCQNCEKSNLLEINYELIIKCNQNKQVDLFEYLFNKNGVLLNKYRIVFKNSSHLEY